MADVTIGAKLQLDANDSVKSMKQIKSEIKEATSFLIQMQEKFGESSKEAINAAKRVNELKDKIKDANEVADLFDPGKKFQAITNAVNGMVGGFTALTGAMGLLGVESEEVQKQLLKVQSALALSQGLSQVADSAKDFKRLGDVIVNTLGKNGAMGLAIAGVTALGLAISGVFTRRQRADVEAYNDTLKDYAKAAAGARQQVVEVSLAFESAKKGLISKDEALKQYNDTLGDSLGKTNDFSKAEKTLADNAENYIKVTALKAQANALFAKSAEQASNALIAQQGNADFLKKAESGGFTGRLASLLQKDINQALDDAKKIEDLGAKLLMDAQKLSQTFQGVTNPQNKTSSGKVTTAAGKQKEKEIEEMDYLEKIRRRLADDAFAKEYEEVQRAKNLRLGEIDLSKTVSEAKIQGSLDAIEARRKETEESKLAYFQDEILVNNRIALAKNLSNTLGALADLVGKQTAAGKALGIAQATINMWTGVTEVLKTKSTLPEPIATISRVANIATVIATGINAIKNITKVQVPGGASGGGGSSSTTSATAPLRPQAAQATRTQLDQQQLNQIGNATVRAFVVESDVTNNQQRVRRLNRAARI